MSDAQQDRQTCITCLYEPGWGPSEVVDGKSTCVGQCRYPVYIEVLPSAFRFDKQQIVRFDSVDGIHDDCQAWAPKSLNTEQP